MTAKTMEDMVSLCKRRGVIFPSNDIYGGMKGLYDFGPIGTELKINLKYSWWKSMIYERDDVDGLDSSIMPATGTPEPGGIFWDEALEIIRIATKNSNIVGADINELAPIKGFNSYNFLVAKLAYKILSY